MEVIAEPEQASMLDLGGKDLNANWVDDKQPLFIPSKPLHWKAHKLQVILARLDKQVENPRGATNFNASAYMAILNEYTRCVERITKGETTDENLDEGELGSSRTERKEAAAMGAGAAASMDTRISADNPLAG